MRSALLLAIATLTTLSAARAETGDNDSGAKAHPAPYPHVHPRQRVVRVAPAAPPPHYSDRSSVYFAIGGLGNFFLSGDDDLSRVYGNGGGIDLTFGLRLNEFVAFEFGWLASFQTVETDVPTRGGQVYSDIRDAAIQSIYFDGKIFFVPSSDRIEPFILLGLGVYMLSESLDAELTGFGFQLGGGVDIRFSDLLALGVKLIYHGFYVDNSERTYTGVPTESAFLNSISAEANVQFHF